MTITAQVPRSGPFTGNGSTVAFTYGFLLDADTELVVVVRDTTTDVITTKVLTTDYSVAGVGTVGGGTVTFVTAPTATEEIAFLRAVPLVQDLDLQNRGVVSPELLENQLDDLTRISQDHAEQLARAVLADAFNVIDQAQLVLYIADLVPIIGDISTVAAISTDVTTVSANIASVIAATPAAVAAAASEAAAALSETAAAVSAAQAAEYDGPWLDDTTLLIADTVLTYTAAQPSTVAAGDYVRTRKEGFSYEVAASAAVDHDLATAGGVKLYVLQGEAGFNVKAFGAAGVDTDDTAAFDAWITALGADGRGCIPAGTYRVNLGRAAFGAGVQVTCHPAVEIAAVGSGATLFSWEATYGATVSLTSNAATGAASIAVAPGDTSGFSNGDMVKLKSTYQPAPVRTPGVTDGELNFIRGTGVGVISFTTHVRSKNGYLTAQGATIQKITTASHGGWTGGTLSAPVSLSSSNEVTFLQFEGCRQPRVRDVVFVGGDRMAVGFSDCAAPQATGNTIRDAVGNVTAYGVNLMDATQDAWVAHNHMINTRHAVTTTNQTSIGGVPRGNKAWHNTIEYSSEALSSPGVGGDAMDCHAASDGHDYSYNTIRNGRGIGIICEGADFTAVGNVITNPFSSGILHMNYSLWTARSKLIDNDVSNPGNDGIEVRNGNASASLSLVILRGNRISANVSGFDDFKVDPNGSTVSTAFVQNNIGSIDKFNVSATNIVFTGNRSSVGSSVEQELQRQGRDISAGKLLFYPHPSGRTVIAAGTQSSAATDDLDFIEVFPGYLLEPGHVVTITPVSNARNVVVRDQAVSGGAGNFIIQTIGSTSVTLNSSLDNITLMWRGSDWSVLSSEVGY
tara:strand:- start:39766 stop:42324 length:2559 start_codon:yes stop_codon:yes gene_type:complete